MNKRNKKQNVEVVDNKLIPVLEPKMIKPIGTVEEATEAFKQYQLLKTKLADKGDFVQIGNKQHPTKQFANKLTKFFGLSVEIRRAKREVKVDKSFVWHIWVRVTATNGQFRDSDGHCHSAERNFSHLEHDVYATAVTRAKNRAILELAGFGEVSAEEIVNKGAMHTYPNGAKPMVASSVKKMTAKQKDLLIKMIAKIGYKGKTGLAKWEKKLGKKMSQLTTTGASTLIEAYMNADKKTKEDISDEDIPVIEKDKIKNVPF